METMSAERIPREPRPEQITHHEAANIFEQIRDKVYFRISGVPTEQGFESRTLTRNELEQTGWSKWDYGKFITHHESIDEDMNTIDVVELQLEAVIETSKPSEANILDTKHLIISRMVSQSQAEMYDWRVECELINQLTGKPIKAQTKPGRLRNPVYDIDLARTEAELHMLTKVEADAIQKLLGRL